MRPDDAVCGHHAKGLFQIGMEVRIHVARQPGDFVRAFVCAAVDTVGDERRCRVMFCITDLFGIAVDGSGDCGVLVMIIVAITANAAAVSGDSSASDAPSSVAC